ncbi:putative Dol-P-Glc:Glc(2)Man(9)GlcNAc(2)-PP-Dol alpha-1,2-glucosyltransferase [Sitophilus oryzae]|uniref:Dol-P-Glc:Glc(2)Man(9)GlcNAc(2)-PP-Dol alpha-1,2-glucosyltransferase n=1 Tax=Sitophilus oryzae TaxID=7048 RepID=A0A6J2YNF7_SITOR|nr:putative Dol-P-Glc:Glc(2)Man(9)GlcNAc(2)-PP-Dol alpha-1,2-glucosyltransferase [Sitophilus oryzae]
MATNPRRILSTMSNRFWLNFSCYLSVLIFFIAFVIINGSIVVGDKEAHQLSINIPQVFYFSLFCLIFGWPYFASEVFNFLLFVKRHKLLITLSISISVLVIYFNTVVHPYLLADNRHFIFYVWNRFYGKYWWFRYSMIPVYIFSLYVIIKLVWDKSDISFSLVFFPAVTLLLIFQSLIEVRYFLVPYLIIRLRIQNKDSAVFNVVLELITYFVINMITFNIFFTKTLHWEGMRHVQRIIW